MKNYSYQGPFVPATRFVEGVTKEVAVWTCKCGREDLLPVATAASGRLNPEHTIKRGERAGWKVVSKTAALCPVCVANKKASGRGESPGPKQLPPPPKQEAPVPPEPSPNVVAMPAGPLPGLTPEQVARSLPSGQRTKIRALFDAHFDDSAGRYLDGYSDAKVAEEAKAPRAAIEYMREAAYGPLRGPPPEVAEAEAAMLELGIRLTEARNQHALLGQAIKSVEQKIATARRAIGLV